MDDARRYSVTAIVRYHNAPPIPVLKRGKVFRLLRQTRAMQTEEGVLDLDDDGAVKVPEVLAALARDSLLLSLWLGRGGRLGFYSGRCLI